MRKLLVYILFMNIILLCCCPDKRNKQVNAKPSSLYNSPKTEAGYVIADTVIYDVIIKNLNSEDKWMSKCLENLKKEQFINQLFESVYNGKFVAHDLLNDKIISPNELRDKERKKEINREKIGKIQFTESWIYNDSLLVMSKKVISISLGLEIFDERGELLGYKHAFKIYLN